MKKQTIWKFPLLMADMQCVSMPAGAKILTVQTQDNQPCLWALVDPNASTEKRCFEVFGTGHPVYPDIDHSQYISTFQLNGGALVYHDFEYTDLTTNNQ